MLCPLRESGVEGGKWLGSVLNSGIASLGAGRGRRRRGWWGGFRSKGWLGEAPARFRGGRQGLPCAQETARALKGHLSNQKEGCFSKNAGSLASRLAAPPRLDRHEPQ